MSGEDRQTADAPVSRRPVGRVGPDSERARRALVALEDGRLTDAESNIDAIADDADVDRAWKCYLMGRLLARRERIGDAIEQFQQCVAMTASHADLLRLAGSALEYAGLLHRRREEPVRAAQAHDRAYRARLEVGSAQECWESAYSLALTAGLRGEHEEAVHWVDEAVRWAEQVPDDADHFLAKSLAGLAELELKAGHMPKAVEAARRAFEAECRHDQSGVGAVRAELSLGRTLLKSAESLHAVEPAGAATNLEEAIQRLQSAKEGMLAFELTTDPDTRWCDELLDFAGRLRSEL